MSPSTNRRLPLLLVVLLAMLNACTQPQPRPAPAPAPEKAAPTSPPPAESKPRTQPRAKPKPAVTAEKAARDHHYTIDRRESLVQIRVHRGGKLARVGHNHLIASRDLQGTLVLSDDLQQSRVELNLPLTSLIVDDPELRRGAGEGFEKPVSADDIAGTRANMLGPQVLDAKRFPKIQLEGRVAAGALPDLTLAADLSLHGITRQLQIPVKLTREGGRLIASGGFRVLQTDFGIKPYSVLLGALRVEDELEIEFRITARRKEGEPGKP